jgi:hypothetical protein
MKPRITKKAVAIAASLLLMGGALAPAAVAAGSDKGNFTCDKSGIPGFGYITSSYNHPDYRHYATAIGTGYATVHADAGATAKAKTGRAFSGNECYYGKS